jgi:DNA polymerase III sliding clamp (beta) subunit (PCNA family)
MIVTLQENLNTGLNTVKVGLPNRTQLPILLTTNDLETVTQCRVGCKVEKPFSTTIPCKILAEAVNLFHNEIVTITYNKFITTLKCNRQTLNFNCKDAQDYPPIPKVEDHSIEVYDLVDAVKKVKDLLTNDKIGFGKTDGLLFDLEKGLIVATDCKRMKIAHINTMAPMKFRISKKAATMLLKFKDTVKITYQPATKDHDWSAVKFESGYTTIITQNLESRNQYPDYQSIADKEENRDLVEVY